MDLRGNKFPINAGGALLENPDRIENRGVYVANGMDISAGTVPAGQNLTGQMVQGMNTNI